MARNIKYIVLEGQTQEDLAFQLYGRTEGVTLLRADNPGLTPDTDLPPGMELTITSDPIDLAVVDYYERIGQPVCTGGASLVTGTPSYNSLQYVLQNPLG